MLILQVRIRLSSLNCTDPPSCPLDGLSIVLFNGNNDQSYNAIDLDGQSTNAQGFFVLGNAGVANLNLEIAGNIQNGADAVALYQGDAADFPNATPITSLVGVNLIDAIVYDTSDSDDTGLLTGLGQAIQFNENENGAKDTESLSRVPDGTGTFVAKTATPGTQNDPVSDL